MAQLCTPDMTSRFIGKASTFLRALVQITGVGSGGWVGFGGCSPLKIKCGAQHPPAVVNSHALSFYTP